MLSNTNSINTCKYVLDRNECNVTRPCNSLANCVNTIGSYQCGCQAGYSGDGISCIGKPIFCWCIEKDEYIFVFFSR